MAEKNLKKIEQEVVSNVQPFVFISHDSKDASLAKAFGELINSASMGVIQYFCSSDRTGKAGIEYGSEWYPTIIENVGKSTDVVCLLTERSINRPWLLYEAGMAKGKKELPVLGLVLGMDMKRAIEGPFAQFQNCTDDKDDLVKLVDQIVRRVPNSKPVTNVINILVDEFLKKEKEILKKINSSGKKELSSQKKEGEASSSAKLYEEIKLMFRDLSDRINRDSIYNKKNCMMNTPRIFMDRFRLLNDLPPRFVVRLGLSIYRDNMPWIYDEGCFLLNQLLTQQEKPKAFMMQFQELLVNSQRIAMNEFEGYREYAWINDFILSAASHIAHQIESKK